MFDEISDNRLLTYLQRYISSHEKYNQNPKLDALKYCGAFAIPVTSQNAGSLTMLNGAPKSQVTVFANEKHSRFTGNVYCHSVWSCPRCAARVMAQRGQDIACAIEALKAQDEYAFMITFTLPHLAYMSTKDSLTILRKTWRMFSRNMRAVKHKTYTLKTSVGTKNKSYKKRYGSGGTSGTKNQFDKRAVGQAGEVREYVVKLDVWANFCDTFEIKHHVRCFEFTWGAKNGWHPHIHMLCWTKKSHFAQILSWENELCDRWWHCAKHCAEQYFNSKLSKDKIAQIMQDVYADEKQNPCGHKSLYISRNEAGNAPRIQESSLYIAGWTADKELTNGSQKRKEAADGHFTPYQLVEKAYLNPDNEDYYLTKFFDYALTVFGVRRIAWSIHSGIKKIVREYKASEQFESLLKKKSMDKGEDEKLLPVFSFTPDEWSRLYTLEMSTNKELKAEILKLARAPDPTIRIREYLDDLYQQLKINVA